MTDARPPIFVSYSHDSEEHKDWVARFATRLSDLLSTEVILDRWSYDRSLPWPAFIAESIWRSSTVLMVCTNGYKRKAEDLRSPAWVSRECIMTLTEFYSNPQKFIPIVCEFDLDLRPAVPYWLATWGYIDFSSGGLLDSDFRELIDEVTRLGGEVPAQIAEMKVSPEGEGAGFEPPTKSRQPVDPNSTTHATEALLVAERQRCADEFLKLYEIQAPAQLGGRQDRRPYLPASLTTFPESSRAETATARVDEFVASSDRVLLILGEVGSGKTTLTKYVSAFFDSDVKRDYRIRVSCRSAPEYPETQGLSEWLDNAFRAEHRNGGDPDAALITVGRLRALANTGAHVLVIVDGLDELSLPLSWTHESLLEAIVTNEIADDIKLLITSRNVYKGALDSRAAPMIRSILAGSEQLAQLWRIDGFKSAFIEPFSMGDVQHYFERAWGARAEETLDSFDSSLMNMVRQPYIARLVADIGMSGSANHVRVTNIIETFVTQVVEESRMSAISDSASWRAAVQQLAFDMFVANKRQVSRRFVDRSLDCVDVALRSDFVDALIACHLLVASGEGRISFNHNAVLEYFVAVRLAASLETFENKELYIRLLTNAICEYLVELLRRLDDDLPIAMMREDVVGAMILLPVTSQSSSDSRVLVGRDAVTCRQYEQFVAENPGMLAPRSEGRELLYQLGGRADIDWFVNDVEGYLQSSADLCWNSTERSAPPGMEKRPVWYVSWFDCWAFCRWAGVRMVTRSEWEIAAYWDPALSGWREYPVESLPEPGINCNCNSTGVVDVERIPLAHSPLGFRHMLGNVAEWTADWSSGDSTYMWIMGGGWQTPPELGRRGNPSVSFPNVRRNFVGFRVGRDL